MPNKRIIDNKELVAKILHDRLELKETTYVISEKYKIPRHTVERVLKELGYTGNIRQNKLEPFKEEILKEYKTHTVNATYLAKKYNVSVRTVTHFLKTNGLQIIPVNMGMRPRTVHQLSLNEIEDIVSAYKESEQTEIITRSNICNLYKISDQTLKRIIKAHDVKKPQTIDKALKCSNINHSLREAWRPGVEFFKQFDDLDKINFYNKLLNTASHRHCNKDLDKMKGTFVYKDVILKFYNDPQASFFYQYWIDNGYNEYLKPSIDHIQPISKGGDWSVDNLQILPKCLNYLKGTMDLNEWTEFIKNGFLTTCVNNLDILSCTGDNKNGKSSI